MYKPWKPVERIFSTHPFIDWCVSSRSVVLNWTEWLNNECQFEMEVKFEEGLAGILCIDESTYQTTKLFGIPEESEINTQDFKPLPWPAWKSELNYRKHLYGELGEIIYTEIYTYYFVGSETVLLIDIADAEPVIKVKKA